MSYLPYGRGAPGGWILSTVGSVAVHAGVIALMSAGVSQWFVERPLPQSSPEFQITLEQLESDTLAGLVERLGEATGLDAAEEMENLDPEGELAPDDAFDDAAIPDAEQVDEGELDALDAEVPDDTAESETPVEEVTPEDPETLDAAEAEDLSPEAPADSAEAEEPDTIEPEDTAQAEPETLEAEEPQDLTPEPLDTLDAAEVDGLDGVTPDALDASTGDDLTEEQTADTLDAAPVEEPAAEDAGELDTVEAEPVEEPPLDTVESVGPEEETVEPEAPEVADLQPVEEAPLVAPPLDDVTAVVPEEDAQVSPTEADSLIVDDGAAQVVTGSPVLDPTSSEDAAPVTSGDLAPIVENDEEVIASTPTRQVEAEDFAALVPVTPPTPGDDATGPETVSPTAQPLDPVTAAPPADSTDTLDPVTAAPTTDTLDPTTATPDGEDTDTIEATPVEPSPPRVTRRMRAPPSERDLAIGDLIQRIRAKTEDNCVIALPRRDGEDGIGLALLAAEDGAMGRFASEVLVRPEDEEIRQTRTLLDERQCAALTFIAKNRDYPATRIGMRLDNAEVASGNRVSGVMRGVGDRNLGLFLVDNNGVVQDLDRFTSTSGQFVRFDVPVTRVGPLRDTKQLLIAIASTEPLSTLKDRSGQRADDFFADLSAELSRQAALAIVAFDVR
ncbi:hypothetical protein CDO87_22890 (plasmid) [Sagittula sp. P11]|uniref:hypothetical protein n=1 Tax=Sagittula sp. P11 TaxID=2009329 RepID=UPI000C2D582C|nr:hypothetical protein [Sagittula sp. P11]AUC56144.1 hypothetical protein CDO87_22890 [Sagittula sp. P11]